MKPLRSFSENHMRVMYTMHPDVPLQPRTPTPSAPILRGSADAAPTPEGQEQHGRDRCLAHEGLQLVDVTGLSRWP